MKKLSYHVNPVVRKREEELHLKNMEAKIRSAKSSIPGAKNKTNGSAAAAYRQQGAGLARQGSRRQHTPSGQRPQGLTPDGMDNQVIDALINARLEDILGQPLIQRIQSMVRGAGIASSPAKGPRQESAIKPPRAARRAPWNDDWSSNSLGPAPGPGLGHGRAQGPSGTRGAVLDSPADSVGTPPRVLRAQSMGRAATPPQLTRAHSMSPSARGEQQQHPSGVGIWTAGEYLHRGSPGYDGGRAPRIGHDARPCDHVHGPAGGPVLGQNSPSRVPATGQRYGALQGQDTALTHSHAAVIDALNPEAADLQQQQQQGAVTNMQRSPSAGTRLGRPPSAVAGSPAAPTASGQGAGASPRVVTDPTLMSLSHLSLAASPAAKGQRSGSGLTGMSMQRSQLALNAGSGLTPRQQRHQAQGQSVGGPAGLADRGEQGSQVEGSREKSAQRQVVEHQEGQQEEELYEDDFEHVEESELQESAVHAGPSGFADIRALRQSVSMLNSLVQMKIQRLAGGSAGGEAESIAAGQQEEQNGPRPCIEEDGPSVPQADDEDGSWTVEDRALAGGMGLSHSLLDGHLGQSSLLAPGPNPAEGWRVLQHSDLEYLDRLCGAELEAHDDGEPGSQDDAPDQHLEAAAPVGDTAAWGDKRAASASSSAAAGAASAARLRQLRQQQQLDQQQLQQQQEGNEFVGASQTALVQEAEALFTSLRKLHELMSGPKAAELSPRSTAGVRSAGGPVTSDALVSPGSEPVPRGTMTPPEEGMELAEGSTEGSPLSLEVQQPLVWPDGTQQGQLTPKHHLCADDVRWMASLMHTLSSSLQGGNLEEWLPGPA